MGKDAKIGMPKKKVDGKDFIKKLREKQLKNKLKEDKKEKRGLHG